MKNNSNIKNVKNKKNNKPLKNKKTVITLIISFAFLLYCFILFIKLLANPTNKFIVEQGKIYKEESQVGYIIRDEQIVENEQSGRYYCSIKS